MTVREQLTKLLQKFKMALRRANSIVEIPWNVCTSVMAIIFFKGTFRTVDHALVLR